MLNYKLFNILSTKKHISFFFETVYKIIYFCIFIISTCVVIYYYKDLIFFLFTNLVNIWEKTEFEVLINKYTLININNFFCVGLFLIMWLFLLIGWIFMPFLLKKEFLYLLKFFFLCFLFYLFIYFVYFILIKKSFFYETEEHLNFDYFSITEIFLWQLFLLKWIISSFFFSILFLYFFNNILLARTVYILILFFNLFTINVLNLSVFFIGKFLILILCLFSLEFFLLFNYLKVSFMKKLIISVMY